MLRLGFGGCRPLLLLVAWSCKSAFLVKYCVRYLGTRLFKHLKSRIVLFLFLLEARVNQFSTQKVCEKGVFATRATAAKTSLLTQFALFLRLFQFAENVKCRRIFLGLIANLLLFWRSRYRRCRRSQSSLKTFAGKLVKPVRRWLKSGIFYLTIG